MTSTRLLVLTLGPPLLIGGAYALSYPAANGSGDGLAVRTARSEGRAAEVRAGERDALTKACDETADELRPRLPRRFVVVSRPPFVLAGNFSEAELERHHREAVSPVAEALWRCYFDHRPDLPVTIVAARDEAAYRDVAKRLDGYEPLAYSGYTQRGERRIVYNAGTGDGTLSHELAHVLASFDFPEMPEWFDEGLAALHEEARFSADGLILTGQENWRCRLLKDALRAGKLPELETVVTANTFRGEGEGLNYAVVRGFCLYLQERGLLAHFYRKFRANVADDPSGLSTLRELLGSPDNRTLDAGFRSWIAH